MGNRWTKRQQRNARIVMQRTENRQQGRPTHSGTGGGLCLMSLFLRLYAYIEFGRWFR